MPNATIVELTIDPTGHLITPSPGRCEPDRHFVFILCNQHPTDSFDLTINFDAIVLKQDLVTIKNPFNAGGTITKSLLPGEVDLIKRRMKVANSFPPNGTYPYTTYKYSVILKDTTTNQTQPPYDPDIDVPPA